MPVRATVMKVAGRYSPNNLADVRRLSLSAGKKKGRATARRAISKQPKVRATQNAVETSSGDTLSLLPLSTIRLRENSSSPSEINIIGMNTITASSPRPALPRRRAASTPDKAPKIRTPIVAAKV